MTEQVQECTVYKKTSAGENLCGFSLNRKCFPANRGLVDQQYKSVEILQQTFYCK